MGLRVTRGVLTVADGFVGLTAVLRSFGLAIGAEAASFPSG